MIWFVFLFIGKFLFLSKTFFLGRNSEILSATEQVTNQMFFDVYVLSK